MLPLINESKATEKHNLVMQKHLSIVQALCKLLVDVCDLCDGFFRVCCGVSQLLGSAAVHEVLDGPLRLRSSDNNSNKMDSIVSMGEQQHAAAATAQG